MTRLCTLVATWLLGLMVALPALAPNRADAGAFVPDGGWRATEASTHPLVGRILDAHAGALIDLGTLQGRLRERDTVLLGEVHDNPDHHRLRAPLLAGRRNVVFEHLRAGQQDDIDRILSGKPATAAEVLERLQWSNSGWPDAALFEPLFAAVLAGGHRVRAGDVDRPRIRDVARTGLSAIPPEERSRLQLDRPLGGEREAALLDELEASHCGLMPRTAFGNMMVAQRYRDAHLALAVRDARIDGGVTLLTGNGHVRRDRAVPWYLAAADPSIAPLIVMFLEVTDDRTDPAAYVERGPDGQPTADVLVFTPRAARADPCEEMRRAFTKRQ